MLCFPYTIVLLILALGMFIVGMSGSLAALSSMIFPTESLAQGIAQDFDAGSHLILRLRVLHPLIAFVCGVGLAMITGWLRSRIPENARAGKYAMAIGALVGLQIVSGLLTVLLLAPIVMQLIHLLLADLIWISFVLFAAEFLSDQKE